MKRMMLGLALLLFTSGCLDYEFMNVRILRAHGEPSVMIAEAVNVYSDESEPIKIKRDFQKLMGSCQEMLTDPEPDSGLNLVSQGCEIRVEKGRIISRVMAVVDHFPSDDIAVTDTEMIWKWHSTDGDIIETNGKIVPSEGDVYVVWPRDAPELRLKARVSRPGPNSHLPLLKLLRDYLADEDEAGNRV